VKKCLQALRLPWRTALLYMLYTMADIHTRSEFRRFIDNDGCDEVLQLQ